MERSGSIGTYITQMEYQGNVGSGIIYNLRHMAGLSRETLVHIYTFRGNRDRREGWLVTFRVREMDYRMENSPPPTRSQ